MKKLLYISVNSKPEEISTSKKVGREFVNNFLLDNPDYELEELDLYNEYIPELTYRHFDSRASLVNGRKFDALTPEEKSEISRVEELCNQFLDGDTIVIATPMWSTFFPARLKRYLDCIIINGKTVFIGNNNVKGLLDDKERNMIYIQSSGGKYNPLLNRLLNHGLTYIKDTFKFLGINKFKSILIEGTEMDQIGKDRAIKIASEKVDNVVESLN